MTQENKGEPAGATGTKRCNCAESCGSAVPAGIEKILRRIFRDVSDVKMMLNHPRKGIGFGTLSGAPWLTCDICGKTVQSIETIGEYEWWEDYFSVSSLASGYMICLECDRFDEAHGRFPDDEEILNGHREQSRCLTPEQS